MKKTRRFRTIVTIVCVLLFSMTLGVAGAGVCLSGDKWTNLPAWWAASSTTLAFVMAALAAWSTWQTLRLEQTRDAERVDFDRRTQARLVAAWCPRLLLDVSADLRVTPRDNMPVLRAINRSGLPVTNVQYALELKVFTNDGTEGYLGPVFERSILEPSGDAVDVPLTPSEWLQVAELILRADGLDLMSDEGWVLTAGIAFTDATGQHWIREQNGQLIMAPEILAAQRARSAI